MSISRTLASFAATAAVIVMATVAPLAARAESQPLEALALGWQTEHADVVFVGEPYRADRSQPGRTLLSFRVGEVLVGVAETGATLVVTLPDQGHGPAWVPGRDHVVFVRRTEDAAPGAVEYAPVSGTFGVRAIDPTDATSRFASVVTRIAKTLSIDLDDGRREVVDPPALRSLLVELVADADPGIALSGASDLVRHRELHDGLDATQRTQLVAAYRACPIGKRTKYQLALTAGISGHPDADDALVQSLLLPGADVLRGAVANALNRLGSPDAETLLQSALADADLPQRRTLLSVLGRIGTDASVGQVREHLSHADLDVRLQAAHALGTIARTVRKADPDARVSGLTQIAERLAIATTRNEQNALTWVLAQLDVEPAYALLRRLAADDERPDVRRYAARYLERPRQSLILR